MEVAIRMPACLMPIHVQVVESSQKEEIDSLLDQVRHHHSASLHSPSDMHHYGSIEGRGWPGLQCQPSCTFTQHHSGATPMPVATEARLTATQTMGRMQRPEKHVTHAA